METNSRKLIKMLKADGWKQIRVTGDHHIFEHPQRKASITVPHPVKDLKPGLVRSVYRLAGWR